MGSMLVTCAVRAMRGEKGTYFEGQRHKGWEGVAYQGLHLGLSSHTRLSTVITMLSTNQITVNWSESQHTVHRLKCFSAPL